MLRGTSAFNQPLNDWDVSSVTDMTATFQQSGYNQPLDNWDVSNVTTFYHMFRFNYAFNEDISDWTVSSATNIQGMVSLQRFLSSPAVRYALPPT